MLCGEMHGKLAAHYAFGLAAEILRQGREIHTLAGQTNGDVGNIGFMRTGSDDIHNTVYGRMTEPARGVRLDANLECFPIIAESLDG